jgi:hypothetical protein
LSAVRGNQDVDWIVVCMHQVATRQLTSSMARTSGSAKNGCRCSTSTASTSWSGHEHHYERSHPIRGQEANATLTPVAAATATDVIDTSKGTVHMVIGGGGTSAPSNALFFDPPQCRVITSVGVPHPVTGKRRPVYVKEQAPWSAVRNAAHSCGFGHSPLIRDQIVAVSP